MWLMLAVYAFAVARVTGLIVSDTITEKPRERFIVWLDNRPGTLGHFLAEVIDCPWCAGMWVSMVAAPIACWQLGLPWILVVPLGLAFSQITGMIHSVGR